MNSSFFVLQITPLPPRLCSPVECYVICNIPGINGVQPSRTGFPSFSGSQSRG